MSSASEKSVPTAVDNLIELLRVEADRQRLKQRLGEYHAADIAEALEDLPEESRNFLLELLDSERAAEVLDEAGEREVDEFVDEASVDRLAVIVDAMPDDEAADILEHADEAKARAVIARLAPGHAADVRELRSYASESAGGIMTKEVFRARPDETVAAVIRRLKDEYEDLETVNEIFVAGADAKLQGVIPVADLIAAPESETAAAIMDQATVTVTPDTDQEVCARFMRKYDLEVLPVLDRERCLIGIITVDDILEVMTDEASEDMYRLVGVGDPRPLEHGALVRAYHRLPWLAVTLVGMGLLAPLLIDAFFKATLEKIVALAFFIPAIMGISGNSGLQASTITVRGLATGEIESKNLGWMLRRELLVALIIGLACALTIGVFAYGILGYKVAVGAGAAYHFKFALTVSTAMFVGVMTAVILGTCVPMLCHRLGVDPAVAAGPFVTTLIDIGAQIIYLSLAAWILLT